MSIHRHRQVDHIKQHILDVGAMVERGVERAVRSIEESDLELAESVINDDHHIGIREVEVDEECLSILALHQPVANDLRFVAAVLKMNNNLERIADHAVNFARRALHDPGSNRPSQPGAGEARPTVVRRRRLPEVYRRAPQHIGRR